MSTLLNSFRQQVKIWAQSRLQEQAIEQTASIKMAPTVTPEPTDTTDTMANSTPAKGSAFPDNAGNHPATAPQKTAIIEANQSTEASLLTTPFTKTSHLFVKTSPLHEKVTPFIEQKLGNNFLVSELLALEPADFSAIKGVGPAKVSVLRQIQREGRLLLSMYSER